MMSRDDEERIGRLLLAFWRRMEPDDIALILRRLGRAGPEALAAAIEDHRAGERGRYAPTVAELARLCGIPTAKPQPPGQPTQGRPAGQAWAEITRRALGLQPGEGDAAELILREHHARYWRLYRDRQRTAGQTWSNRDAAAMTDTAAKLRRACAWRLEMETDLDADTAATVAEYVDAGESEFERILDYLRGRQIAGQEATA